MMTEPRSKKEKRGSVDWDAVRGRLDAARQVTGQMQAPGPDERKRILNERARLLAAEESAGTSKEESITVVEFLLASEHYAVGSEYVTEMLQIRELTPLPGTPPFLLGIINIRGEICSVIDLKKFFSLPDRGLPEFNKVIVIENETMKFGIVVDSVTGTRRILKASLKSPPPTFTGIRADYVKGIAPGPVIVLDAAGILSDRDLVVNEQV
jgi:purine-binding chemotaxis protein CheW